MSDAFERGVFEHDHLLPDVREVDGEQSVAAGTGDIDDDALAPLGMTHAVARVQDSSPTPAPAFS